MAGVAHYIENREQKRERYDGKRKEERSTSIAIESRPILAE